MHRIPHGKKSTKTSKGPVFLMHGLLCSSADWIVLGEKSLALTLADAGYDVWMGNNRGNTYSHDNTRLSPFWDYTAFFQYSYNEIGAFDLPAMVDYVRNNTGKEKIPYVGFSEGTTSFWVLMSDHPEYNEKISTMVGWAPVTDMYRIRNRLINFVARHPYVKFIAKALHWNEMFPHRKIGNLYRALCAMSDTVCSKVFHLIGMSYKRMPNKNLKDNILKNFPAGMSLQQVLHYVQGAETGAFRPYDYGLLENLAKYNKAMPDRYNISATTIPVELYYGGSDSFVNIELLLNKIVNPHSNVNATMVPLKEFDHLDFIWGRDVEWLNQQTISALEKAGEGNTTTTTSSEAPTTTTTSSKAPTTSTSTEKPTIP